MENNKKTGRGKIIAAVAVLIVAAAALAAVYLAFGPKGAAGEKTITVEVVLPDGSTETAITTDEAYLRGALEQEGMIAGEESEYGLFVTAVNGVAADDSKEQWWCFTKDGESLATGVDSTPIADGEHYEITLTEGY